MAKCREALGRQQEWDLRTGLDIFYPRIFSLIELIQGLPNSTHACASGSHGCSLLAGMVVTRVSAAVQHIALPEL